MLACAPNAIALRARMGLRDYAQSDNVAVQRDRQCGSLPGELLRKVSY